MTQDTKLVLTETDGPVATLTLANPAARNALSLAMLDALSQALEAIDENDALRVVLLQAEGPAFCAGHDLKELTARRNDPDRGRAFIATTMRACSADLAASACSCTAPASQRSCRTIAAKTRSVRNWGLERIIR